MLRTALMWHASATAPAKINLSLSVTGRRDDGYHLIDSTFLPLALADLVTVEVRQSQLLDIRCQCPGQPNLSGDDNLAAKAARAVCQSSALTVRADIVIEKRIWSAAGLGGGSSDAATTLRLIAAFAETRGRKLSETRLFELGLSLGADVPFFLAGSAARARGIGEQLQPISVPRLELVLANPGVDVSTRTVYEALHLAPGTSNASKTRPHMEETRLSPTMTRNELLQTIVNDLEPAAIAICPAIEDLKNSMRRAGASAVGMSGSGPTVFGIFESPTDARRVAQQLAVLDGVRAVATRTI